MKITHPEIVKPKWNKYKNRLEKIHNFAMSHDKNVYGQWLHSDHDLNCDGYNNCDMVTELGIICYTRRK